MCGPLCACFTSCFTSCLHGNTQLDACCFCIPLRVGALIFAAFYVIVDIILLAMFDIRYQEDPFEYFTKDNATASENILEDIRRRLLMAVYGVHPCILILIIFFAVWLVIDTVLIVSAALEWPVVIRIWGCLSMFRSLHVFIDIFLIVITTILVKDADAYLIPNYIALAALIPLSYARCVIASYAHDIKTRDQIQRDVSKQMDSRRPSTALK